MDMDELRNKRETIALHVIALFGIITFALAAATLGTLNKRFDDLNQQVDSLHQKLTDLSSKLSTTTLVTTEKTTTVATTEKTTSGTAQTSAT